MEKLIKQFKLSGKVIVYSGVLFIISMFIMSKYDFGTIGYRIGAITFVLSALSVVLCFIVYMDLAFKIDKIKKENYYNQIQKIHIQNLLKYHESLQYGDRKSVLNYGRMCGFSEHTITNDLLCLLNNNK